MRRVVIQRPGGHERLSIEEQRDPRPASGEVAVEVQAIGVNYADVIVRMGLYSSAREYVGWPITPGFEIAGTVAEVGPGVSGLRPGQPVLGVTRFGGYATRVVAPAAQLFSRPASLTPVQAAAFPTVFLTAHYALFELARPLPGSAVLVHSAAGGVGSALLQLCRAAGCDPVVGVVGGGHKVSTAREHGATHVIDTSTRRLWPEARRLARGYQAIFDANGVATLRQSYRHLAPTGRLVVYGFHSMLPRTGGRPRWLRLAWDYLRTPRFDPLDMTQRNRSVMAFNLSYLFAETARLRASMDDLLARLARGELRPLPCATYPLDEVARAHRDLESGRTVGKLVLVP